MPVKRRVSKGRLGFDYPIAVHLADGDCLLAGEGLGCGCELIGPDGVFNEPLAALFRKQYAPEIAAVKAGARELEIRQMLARHE